MAVYIESSLWPHAVPYVADEKAEQQIQRFNQSVRKAVFVQRATDSKNPDHVVFKPSDGHSACTIGKKGGAQTLLYTPESIIHEMCHCLGLGHENFHKDWPLGKLLVDRIAAYERKEAERIKTQRNKAPLHNAPIEHYPVHAKAYSTNVKKYTSLEESYDPLSIMLYSPAALFHDQPLPPEALAPFVPNTQLSQWDIAAIKKLYAFVADLA